MTETSIDLLKRALSDSFFKERRSFVTFRSNHLELDLKAFLATPEGKEVLSREIESAKRVPEAPTEAQTNIARKKNTSLTAQRLDLVRSRG